MERGPTFRHVGPKAPRKPALKHLDVAIPKGVAQVARFKNDGVQIQESTPVASYKEFPRIKDWKIGWMVGFVWSRMRREKCIMIMEPFPWRRDFRSQLFLCSARSSNHFSKYVFHCWNLVQISWWRLRNWSVSLVGSAPARQRSCRPLSESSIRCRVLVDHEEVTRPHPETER